MNLSIEEDYEYHENMNLSYHDNYSYEDYHTVCEKSEVRSFAGLFLPVVYTLCLMVGLAGNTLVVAVYAYHKQLKTMTDGYLTHLAVADLLLLLTLPFWAADAVQGWEVGEALCKIVSACYTINFTCCMLLLASISLDRYLASVGAQGRYHGFLRRVFHRRHGWKACLVVWTVALVLGLPELIFSTVRESTSQRVCMVVYPYSMALELKAFLEVMEVLLGFLLPLLVMVYCYYHVGQFLQGLPTQSRGRKWRAVRLLLLVVGVFVVTQLPYNILKVYRAMDSVYALVTHCDTSKALDQAAQITESLALIHCCLNPVLYAFLGSSFRQHVLKVAKAFGERSRRRNTGREATQREEQVVEISLNSHSASHDTSTFSI